MVIYEIVKLKGYFTSSLEKMDILEATEILSDIEAQVDRIKNWLWLSDDEKAPNIDITDMSSNVVRNLEFEKRILKKLLFIADRLGC